MALASSRQIHIGILTSVSCANAEVHEGIEMFPVINAWRLTEALKVVKVIRSWAPDIVHIQYPTQGYGGGLLPWFLPLIAFLLGKRVVQTWHEGYSRRSALQLLLKAVVPSRLVVVRPQYKEDLLPLFRWALSRKNFLFIRSASTIPRVLLDKLESNKLRVKYLNGQKRLIVYFGFVYPNKGIEFLFEIANPDIDRIVIAGENGKAGDYGKIILEKASAAPWQGKATITGFLPPREVAELLSVADAVILPFRVGGGEWNTSIHAAILQGSFVITTSLTRKGYDQKHNAYYAKIDNVEEMRSALGIYAGVRREYADDLDRDEWGKIAHEHCSLYKSIFPEQ